jgi:hypothetical protein
MQWTSTVYSTVLRNTNFKAKFTVHVICHPTLFVSFIPSIIVDNQESPQHDWCLNTKTRESYTIQYYSWMKVFVPTVWKLCSWNPKFMTAPRFFTDIFPPLIIYLLQKKKCNSTFQSTSKLCI